MPTGSSTGNTAYSGPYVFNAKANFGNRKDRLALKVKDRTKRKRLLNYQK